MTYNQLPPGPIDPKGSSCVLTHSPSVPADFKLQLRSGFHAYGRPFLANPDLVSRLRQGAGYTDYPRLSP